MLRLILMRHGHAAFGDSDDKSRTLTPQGCEAVRNCAKQIVEQGWMPDRVLVSDAERTRQTATHAVQLIGSQRPNFLPELYGASASRIRDQIYATQAEDFASTVLVIGHNPGISDLATQLNPVGVGMSPACAALLQTQATDWTALELSDWHLAHFIRG